MNVDGLPTTIGSFLVDPFIAPTMEPPPVHHILMSEREGNNLINLSQLLKKIGENTCPLLSICKMSDRITIGGYKKASWIFSNTKGAISLLRKKRTVLEK